VGTWHQSSSLAPHPRDALMCALTLRGPRQWGRVVDGGATAGGFSMGHCEEFFIFFLDGVNTGTFAGLVGAVNGGSLTGPDPWQLWALRSEWWMVWPTGWSRRLGYALSSTGWWWCAARPGW
jgi:hypothetical protein